jgi:Zn-dependent M28 family amino/carboxypeptidase
VVACAAALFAGGCVTNQMPGKSFVGPLPAMAPEETELAAGLRRHVEKLAVEIGERNVQTYDELLQTSDYIATTLEKFGYTVTRLPYEAAGKQVTNLAAELPGSGPKADEILVVGAHYDTVRDCPGANDNGTGVAAVLDMARLMAQDKPNRTVRFVLFVNEEPPFFQTEQMGSLVYARKCKADGDRIVGMISMETIGFYSDARGSQKYPVPFNLVFPDTGNYIAFVTDNGSRDFVMKTVGAFRRLTSFPSEGVAAPASVQGVGWSDHWSFRQVGYPALMVTDTAPFRYAHYHETTDTPDKIDFDRTARVVMGVTRVLREMAGSDE